MEQGGEFYVVRKGNTIAVYKNLTDCQAQIGSSITNPAVSVYKGNSWSKQTEEYLISHGLKNPLYTIDASETNNDLFGSLVPCPFQNNASAQVTGLIEQNKKQCNLGNSQNAQPSYSIQVVKPNNVPPQTNNALCILEFDGASKGNPGKAGAGAVIRTENGKLICRLSEGLGVATNNVAEYKSVILGLKYALNNGFKRIDVRGDSNLVVMQVQGLWQCKHQNMISLHKEVIELKSKFQHFKIQHVRREFNSDADQQANKGVELREGQISEDYGDGL